jgi:hypothetical protein
MYVSVIEEEKFLYNTDYNSDKYILFKNSLLK